MGYSNQLIAAKLRRWEGYMADFKLPDWENIPDFGLYMEQVIILLQHYLDFLPPELKDETFLTAATINNYVRKRVMPEPVRKKYYRIHIAYLIVILTLKQSLSIAMIQKILPIGLSDSEVRETYNEYAERHRKMTGFFISQIRQLAGPILEHEDCDAVATAEVTSLITSSAIIAEFCQTLAVKLILLEGKDMNSGENLTIEKPAHH